MLHPEPREARIDPGVVLGERYLLLRELGAGGMGRVFAARDLALERDVAVKLLREATDDRLTIARFGQEARAAGALNHPNVLTVFDIGVGRNGAPPFIVTELLEGFTLKEMLAAGPLPQPLAFQLALQLAQGLSAAHQRGIVHRDIKPANLFVAARERLKILDFGVAKLLADPEAQVESGAPRTETGKSVGTVGYMSPEQVRGQAVSDRSDLFGFGVVLFEMLTGRRPFSGGSAVETAYAILSAEPPPLPSGLPPSIEALIKACLQKQPAQRPSASDAAAALQSMIGATPSAAMTPLKVDRVSASPSVAWRRHLRIAVAAALVAGVAILAAGLSRTFRARAVDLPVPRGPVLVAPFSVPSQGELAYLGEGVVDLFANSLSNRGIVAIDPKRAIQALRTDPDPRVAAQKLGAGSYLTGVLRPLQGGALGIEARLFAASDGLLRLATAAEGPTAEPGRAIEAVVSSLQARLGPASQGLEAPSPKPAPLARSGGALRAYLEGEALLRRSEWTAAIAAFQRAVGFDPDFGLAHYRLAVAAATREPGLAQDALQRALSFRQSLSPSDLALAEAFSELMDGNADSAERRYREILSGNPDAIEANFQLGELLFHWNPLRGRLASESADYFNQTVVLDPHHGLALAHLIDLALQRGSKSLALALVDRYLEAVKGDDASSVLSFRWVRAWATDNEPAKQVLLELLARTPAAAPEVFTRAVWEGDHFFDARRIAKSLADATQDPRRAYGLLELAFLELGDGQAEVARDRMAQALALTPDPAMRYYALWLESLPGVHATPASTREALRQALGADFSTSPELEPFRLHLAGTLALRAGDPGAAQALAERLKAMPSPARSSVTPDLARELQARIALASGRIAEANKQLDAMELRIPYRTVGFFAHVAPRHLRAELLRREGKHQQARELEGLEDFYDLTWFTHRADPGRTPSPARAGPIGAHRR